MEKQPDSIDKFSYFISNLIRNIHDVSAPILVPVVSLFWPLYWAFEKDYFQTKPETLTHECFRYFVIFIWSIIFIYLNIRSVKRTGNITKLKSENQSLNERIEETNQTVTELNGCVREAWRLFYE